MQQKTAFTAVKTATLNTSNITRDRTAFSHQRPSRAAFGQKLFTGS